MEDTGWYSYTTENRIRIENAVAWIKPQAAAFLYLCFCLNSIFEEILDKVYASNLDTEYFVLRYGYQNIGKQRVYMKKNGKFNLCIDEETGFKTIKPEDRRGYGEVLTAKLLKRYHVRGVINEHNKF